MKGTEVCDNPAGPRGMDETKVGLVSGVLEVTHVRHVGDLIVFF
jgi:hypothetical protein